MKRIFFTILFLTPFFYLHALAFNLYEKTFLQNTKDAYEREIKKELGLSEKLGNHDHERVQALFKQRLGALIQHVREQIKRKEYKNEDLGGFLAVAMVSKHGLSDGMFKNIPLAYELFEIVSETTWSDSFHLIAERSLLTCNL